MDNLINGLAVVIILGIFVIQVTNEWNDGPRE